MISDLFNREWLTDQLTLKLLIRIASRDRLFADVREWRSREQAVAARGGERLRNTNAVTMRGDIAVIDVTGPLFRHADMFSDISGASTYDRIAKDVTAAKESASVRGIILVADSPGGEANGCDETAEIIKSVRGVKPIRGYVDGYATSAMYWLIAACDDVTAAPTAFLGSIGAVLGVVDDRKAQQMIGIEQVDFVSSVSPMKRPDVQTDAGKASYQARVDALGSFFASRMAELRGVSLEHVLERFGGGDVLMGAAAVEAGLADQLGTFEGLLAEMASATTTSTVGRPMKTASAAGTTGETITTSVSDGMCSGCGAKMSGKAFCAKCHEGDGDDDEEARAFRAAVFATVGATTTAEALGKITAGVEALRDLPTAQAALATERAEGIRRNLRATLESGLATKQLSLGRIQTQLPLVLRGETKAAWATAMGKVKAVTKDAVLDAASAVAITAEDLAAIGEYATAATPTAAEPFVEPRRDSVEEAGDLDEGAQRVKAAADRARATLDRADKRKAAAKAARAGK